MRKSKILTLLAIPFLLSCTKVPEYNGVKIQLNYAENGGLREINADQLYERAITLKKDMVVLFTIDGCSSCDYAKEQVNSYGVAYNMIIHQINMSNIDVAGGDYEKITAATTYFKSDDSEEDIYEFPPIEEATFPMMYMFKLQGVAVLAKANFVDALRMYVEVVNKPSTND